jgi:hypothetical protein
MYIAFVPITQPLDESASSAVPVAPYDPEQPLAEPEGAVRQQPSAEGY